jgi:hypothetical protein
VETILFLIIVGILSTIFGKGKRKGTPSAKRPFSTNSKDIRTIFKEFTNYVPSKTSPINSELKTESLKHNLKDLEKEYQQVRQESEISRIGMATSRQLAEKNDEQPIMHKHEDGETIIFEKPDANTLVNGIIWSEILGEPRSKKPYMTKRR